MSLTYKVKIETDKRVSSVSFDADTYEIAKLKALDFAKPYPVLEFYLADKYDNILFYWSAREKAPLHLALMADGQRHERVGGMAVIVYVAGAMFVVLVILVALLMSGCTPSYYL